MIHLSQLTRLLAGCALAAIPAVAHAQEAQAPMADSEGGPKVISAGGAPPYLCGLPLDRAGGMLGKVAHRPDRLGTRARVSPRASPPRRGACSIKPLIAERRFPVETTGDAAAVS